MARREAELNKREAEVRRMEMELANSPGAKNNKNWPRFCPVAHHDIAGEIPADKQSMIRSAYWSYLGMVWCMFFNFVAVTGALIVNSGDNLSAWLWAVIYALGGIPLGFTLWYMRVYNAAIKDRALSYGLFFIFFMAHLIFVGWSAVGEAWRGRVAERAGGWRASLLACTSPTRALSPRALSLCDCRLSLSRPRASPLAPPSQPRPS